MKQEDKCGGKSGQKRWKIWREKWEQTTAARVTGNVADIESGRAHWLQMRIRVATRPKNGIIFGYT